MGQPCDGVYDVLGNLVLTPRSAPALFLPPQHSYRPTRPEMQQSGWSRDNDGVTRQKQKGGKDGESE